MANVDLLPIDTVETSSFLNHELLKDMRMIVSGCIQEAEDTKKRMVFKAMQKHFIFEKVFETRGVQGITGILKCKKLGKRVVFKVSVSLDRSVEHENLVTSDLNALREFCPHFVGNIGMINLPVSNDFVNDPENESLFKNNNDYFPCNVLLIEYVSPISLYHVCKYLHPNRSVIISQLAQIMIALDVAQTKRRFVSYDLHLDNVLMRACEEDTLFLYRNKGRTQLVPTYGLYPVIIDLGSSYVKAIEGKPMYTSADNYHNGLQPTLFDNLNDVHHLLVSILHYLEDKSYCYDWFRTRIMYIFRNVPILSEKGWKQLPYDIMELALQKIEQDCPDLQDKYPVFEEYDDEIIDIINGLIILPWIDEGNVAFGDCIPIFLDQLQKIQDMKSVNSTDDVLYILRETVESINAHRDAYESDPKKAIDAFTKDWKVRIGFIISNNMKEIPKDLDFEILFTSALKVAERLSANYYVYVQEHCEVISDAYLQTKLTSPWDAAHLLLQNATPSFKVTRTNKIYIFDADKECKQLVIPSDLTDEQLEIIDNASIFKKGNLLLEFLSK